MSGETCFCRAVPKANRRLRAPATNCISSSPVVGFPTGNSSTLAAANAGAFRSMDEIRNQCARLLSDDVAVQSAAFQWLRQCKPFRRLLLRFREHDLTLFDLAADLEPNSKRPLTGFALEILGEEIAKGESC